MKLTLVALACALTAAGCATAPSGLPAGQFVTLQCADNKSFQARMSDDGRTVRVRAHHGSAELDSRGEGRYAGNGYMLNLRGEGGVALEHDGKSQGKACKATG